MKRAKAPTAQEKRWHDWLRDKGCAACGAPTAIHHAIGSTGRHNKIHIGQWWVNNLCYEHHQGQGGIHSDLSAFTDFDKMTLGRTRKDIEKSIFRIFSYQYKKETGEAIPIEVKEAIEGYRR